ncbi:aminoglycoside phosphotransferase family protein [Pseudodonghicola flavimaris]|uniref:Phosphotransferase n=1 Tax=Pseudodonghicola flavimaris TaxID=3050036 RepID=A0ABT7F015_9RHOB|nr:phosphotransferase [Pseudodonghicola flavimaris]MDK3017834.1 phosphotransferase [Pseudodonghicola flavimaris]
MTDRAPLATAFVAGTRWAGAARAPLAGDASNRRYERLRQPQTGQPAVLMDAAPERGEDVRPFIAIDRFLRDQELSAPEIYAENVEHGFLLLEDLGDDLYARVLERDPEAELLLYRHATNVLIALADTTPPALPVYGPEKMAELSGLAFSKYRKAVLGDEAPEVLSRFLHRFENILTDCTGGTQVICLRDYHAENLLWLPDRVGLARVGLLDFQDAMLGHPAYDLVSLLQDIRRQVSPAVEIAMLQHYIAATGCDDHAFRTAYAVLGAQRNLRILGVFARLTTDYGKPHYADMIPAVWAHVKRNLEHPALAPLADMLIDALPAPTPEVIAGLKSAS